MIFSDCRVSMCGFCVTLLNLPLWAFLPLPLHLTIGALVLADWYSTPVSKSLSMCNCMCHSLECNFWVFISAPSFFLHLGYRFSHKYPISSPCLLSHPLLVLVLWYSIPSSYHTCHPSVLTYTITIMFFPIAVLYHLFFLLFVSW